MELSDLYALAVAVGIGFIVGFERDWTRIGEARQRSFAGARTFALAGMLGGLSGLSDSDVMIAAGLLVVGALTIAAYWAKARDEPGSGGTTEMAVLAVYALGAFAGGGAPMVAAVGGIATAILLSVKPWVTKWAGALEAREIYAALRFLAIAVILLPLLPDTDFGPYGAINPRGLCWMVVLISGLSFAGYWLTKFMGARGLVLTGAVGGLASSTATTLSLSRLAKAGASSAGAAAGVVAANIVMLARIAVLLFTLSRPTLLAAAPALAAAGLAGLIGAVFMQRNAPPAEGEVALGNPLELGSALFFTALLAAIAIAARAATALFGDAGLIALAAFTGLADVDAVTIAAAGQAASSVVGPTTAAAAVLLAAAVNMAVKAGIFLSIAGRAAGVKAASVFAAMGLAAAAAMTAANVFQW